MEGLGDIRVLKHGPGCTCRVCAQVLVHVLAARELRNLVTANEVTRPDMSVLVIGRRMRWARALRQEHGLTTGEGDDE